MGVSLDKQVEEATLTYRVKFDKGYDWTRGGKLPGLCDDGVCSSAAEAISLLDNRSDGENLLFSTKRNASRGSSVVLLFELSERYVSLHRVYSADCPGGCRNTHSTSSGWSSRMMWRDQSPESVGASTANGPDVLGRLESYMYLPFECARN